MTEYAFNPSTISVSSGKVVFFLVNAGTISHDMVIRNASGQKVSGATSELVSAGDSFIFTVTNLPAGSYATVLLREITKNDPPDEDAAE